MSVPVDKLRVVSRDVGGAFGMRTSGYPEYPAMLVAAKMLGRPVRWRSTRQEGFLTDNQARDTIIEGRLAMDADGKFLALDIDSIAALGAYHTSHGAFIATVNFARCRRACTASRRWVCASDAFSPTRCRVGPTAARGA